MDFSMHARLCMLSLDEVMFSAIVISLALLGFTVNWASMSKDLCAE